MKHTRHTTESPYFSICIPQYNRTSFLLELIDSLVEQTFENFEVCISDDRSPDGRQQDVVDRLEETALDYTFKVQPENRQYDGNMRAAIGLARGKYCFLIGNDDALVGADTLEQLQKDIERLGPAGVVITDYEDYRTGEKANRIRETQNYGSGPEVAANHFRNFSFVGGVLLDREIAHDVATNAWDGSEMYQTYVGSRIIASGRNLLELERRTVRQSIHIPGEDVDSYAERDDDRRIKERRLPLSQLARVVSDAISPFTTASQQRHLNTRILTQLIVFTYAYWLFEYRRTLSWQYAFGVGIGMRPSLLAKGMSLSSSQSAWVYTLYAAVTVAGLTLPISAFRSLKDTLYRIAKST